MQSFLNLSLAHNKLQGQIPEVFGELKSLESLNLSYNNFSGVIPTSMEGLLQLENLNLSSNQLQGRLPSGGPFENFTESFFMSNLQERWTVWPASKFPNLKE
ncbi:hypothetical protein NC652_035369 [Populus alba x Populus x berolinensis]|nr:hypothetical protein NC652_035369 [Populus alba x Populus x berolinensis]